MRTTIPVFGAGAKLSCRIAGNLLRGLRRQGGAVGRGADPGGFKKMRLRLVCGLCCCAALAFAQREKTLPKLKVSPDHRFVIQEDGKPFFYLADTGWELFHRMDRKDAAQYLKIRASQGFTVIQA